MVLVGLGGCKAPALLKLPTPARGEPVDPNDPGVVGPELSRVSNPTPIRFSSGVTEREQKILEFDLTQLSESTVTATASLAQLKKVMGLAGTENPELLSWLEARVAYIVPESLSFEASRSLEQKNYSFQNPGTFLTEDSASPQADSAVNDSSEAKVMMSNLGAYAYLSEKKEGNLYSMELGDLGKVTVTSPRVGVVQIGEGLFAEDYGTLHQKPWGLVSVINRLGTLFHEARHSDGNGASLAFAHALCPKGHSYEGRAACDRNLNGPYLIGALMIRSLEAGCVSCTAGEHELLKLIELDYLGRVIAITHPGDPGAPETLKTDLESTSWDATPEGVL